MSMNKRMKSPSSGGAGGSGESTDLTGKDVLIMLAAAAVVVFVFGTLVMEGSDDSSGDSGDDMQRFITQTEPGQERLDIDADEGYVRPGEAEGPRTGELKPEFDPHQLSAREVDKDRLKEGDFSDFGAVSPDEVPEVSQSEMEMLNEIGADMETPPSVPESWEHDPPTMDEIRESVPSEIREQIDLR